MAVVDLNLCIPEGKDGTRQLLPKQKQFYDCALDPNGPKYILYAGGVGSAKTTIGCITVLSMAVQFPGDYLICRLFNPELRITSYKTFLDLCPKELIAEHRVADQIVKIKSTGGKVSNVIFRGLEEPDKHRSLNLNAAWIDESSQVSEAAFVLLQSRLRGPYVRKILLTTNPAGRDWQWRNFVDQKNLPEVAKPWFKLIKAPSTENKHLPDGYVQSMLATYSKERIDREIYASFDSFAGQIYSEFDRSVHVIKPFKVPDEWTKIVGCDHGFRNPTAWVFGAVDYDGNVYIYREFYKREWTIQELCRGKTVEGRREPGLSEIIGREKITGAYIDPSTKAVKSQTGASDFDTYLDHLPRGFPLFPAKNDVQNGIDRVKTYLKVDEKTKKPRLYIFDSCVNLLDELVQYQWQEQPDGMVGRQNPKEEPKKVNDHACDALRYLLMSRPDAPTVKDLKAEALKVNTLEASLQRDLDRIKNPKPKDPFQDW